ncbi:MAG: AAA family ATPase [bacterium]
MGDNKNNIKYNICTECDGSGKIDGKKCLTCNGRGVELIINGETYYWQKSMSFLHIYQRRGHILVNGIINFVLVLLGVFSILSLAYYGYLVKNPETVIKNVLWSYEQQTNYLLLIFWLGVIIFMGLVYRMNREFEKGQRVKKFFSHGTDTHSEPDLDLRIKDKKIEISACFTRDGIIAVEKTYNLARKSEEGINPLSLFISLMFFEKINIIFFRLGIDYNKLKTRISHYLKRINHQKKGDYFLKKVLLDAYLEAYNAKKEKVDVMEILVSLLKNDPLYKSEIKGGVLNEIMYEMEIDLKKIINVVEWLRINEKLRKNWNNYRHRSFFKPNGKMDRAMTAVATPHLDQFGQDLTILAKSGYLEPCIGREKEIAVIFRIFESGSAGVILTGNPGVGKNSVVEGIAQMMAAEDVPEIFQDKRFVSLSLARLISGANPEQAMGRLMGALNEAIRSGNIILFIDSIESMIGISAGKEASLDLSEVLSSSMTKHRLTVIATTTPIDYTKYVEQSALVDVFQRVAIDEPEDNEAIQILEGKTSMIEAKEKVFFSYGAVEKALYFTKRFIHDRFLPEKAINIIEEAGVFTRRKKGRNSIITVEDIAELISQKIKIPLNKLTQKESESLLNLEEKIHERMIDQADAVKAVADSLRRARVEFRDIKRPIANLLFLGPTGVGKTELAKSVAEIYFGREEDMIRIDMSEYQNKDSVDRLIGAPDNYEVSGILTEAVRKHPYALVLLDEIEKAHPDILNLFLQVMDDGRLTDNRGRTIDFTSAIIIMTSNAGTAFIQDEIKKGTDISQIKNYLMNKELKLYFRPEFLNRFDEVIVFKPLSMDDVKAIAKLMLKSSAKKMDEKGIKLEFTDDAINWIARLGYDPTFGARPLRRAIQENIDTLLAKYLISEKISRGDRAVIDKDGEIRIERD